MVVPLSGRQQNWQPSLLEDFLNQPYRFEPDSQWLAAATADGHIELRRVDDLDGSDRPLTDVITDVTSLSISPKGSWLAATTGHNEAYLWSMREDSSGQLVVGDRVTLAGHTQPVTAMEFSHDDRWLGPPLPLAMDRQGSTATQPSGCGALALTRDSFSISQGNSEHERLFARIQ